MREVIIPISISLAELDQNVVIIWSFSELT